MKILKLTAVFIFLFIGSVYCNEIYTPETADPLLESWRWKSFPELGDKGIRCIAEGKDNTLWFGTGKGLYHYNGIAWKHFQDENEILTAPVYGLCYTTSEILYVVSPKGIAHLEKNAWHTDLLFPETGVLGDEWEILNSMETRNRDIWLGLYFGLLQISKDAIVLYTTPEQIKETGATFNGVEIRDMSDKFVAVDPFIVFDMLEDKSGGFWLGLEDGRILRIPDGSNDLSTATNYRLYSANDSLLISRLPLLFESKEGLIYAVSQSIGGGINTFSGTWSSVALSATYGGDNLNFSINETPDGTIWVGGLSRLFSFRNGLWTEYRSPAINIPPTRILIYPVSDGSLWIAGHLADVARVEYSTPQWQTFKDLLYQCETDDGRRWFITPRGEIVYQDKVSNFWEKLTDEFPLSDPVRLFLDNNSDLWALGSHQGVAAVARRKSGRWQMKTFPELCWSFHPNGVYQTRDNALWFGANADCGDAEWGILRYDPETGSPEQESAWQHFKGDEVCEVAYALCETDENTLLCGYYKGLFEYDGNSTKALHKELKGDILKIECMTPDPVEGVWIGTRSQGVIHYMDEQNWQQYTVEEGLASNSVASLMVGDDSCLWAATDKGISMFDRTNWTRLALPEYFKIIRGNGYLRKGKDNSIWICQSSLEWFRRVFYDKEFASENSPLVSYQIKPEDNPPETRISQYEEKVYYPGNTMIFWEGTDRWNATDPDKLQFSFRMDDGPWSEFTHEAEHNFLSLHRGRHQLQVRARDNFMNIDPTPATVNFRVIPPLWGRVWFILLLLAIVTIIIYQMISSQRKNREMQEQNKIMRENNENLIKQQNEIEEKGKQIMELLEKERENQWLNEGILTLNETIKKNRDDYLTLSNQLLIQLVQYLEATSGAILLYQEDPSGKEEPYLERVGSYGLNKERLAQSKILLDEGMTGACFRDKKTMVVDKVPDSYYVESGLGKSVYTEIVLVPLKLHETIVGILEIASLKKMEEKKIRLMESIAENIASNIISLQSAEKIQEMYRLSQEQTARLHEQEEEMRQQMEELQATQEESQRREEELKKALEECRRAGRKKKH